MSTLDHFLTPPPPSLYTRGGSVLWEKIKEDIGPLEQLANWEHLKYIFCGSFLKITGHSIGERDDFYIFLEWSAGKP